MSPPSRRSADTDGGWQAGLRAAGPYVGLGFQLAGSVLFYVIAGYLLDRWLETEPWLLVTGAALGMVTFFVQLARVVRRLNEETRMRAEERRRRAESDRKA